MDGCGFLRNNLYDIFWNLVLVANGIRPSFMIQPIDYEKNNRDNVLKLIFSELNSYLHAGEHIFETTCINQGILVYLSKNVSDEKTHEYVKKNILEYNLTNNNTILGNLLGYPCSGDVGIPMASKNRGFIILSVNDSAIMANICNSKNKKVFFEKLNMFREIKEKLCYIKKEYFKIEDCSHDFTVHWGLRQ